MLHSSAVLKPTPPSQQRTSAAALAVSAAVAVGLFGQLGAIGLTGPDEPRYVWIARAMAETGDWVTPRLYGQPWFEKPILYYWAAALGFRLHLSQEWAARLPSALAALAAVAMIVWFARKFYPRSPDWSRNPAYLAPLIFSTSIAAAGFARAATPDMLFSVSIALAMAAAACILDRQGLFRPTASAITENKNGDALPLLLWGAFLGLGTLAKGPAAVILSGGAIALWALAAGTWRKSLRLLHPFGIVAFLVVALPWYILCALRNPDFLRVFILQHNFERYLTPIFQHRQPFWFFGPIFLAALLPWTILLWPATQEGLRLWREKSWRDSPGFFLACWTLFPILFFSLSQSKLPSYILPAMPAAALLAAVAAIRAFEPVRKTALVPLGLAAAWLALSVTAFVFLRRIDWQAGIPDARPAGLPPGVYFAVALLVLSALVIAFAGWRGNARWSLGLCAFCFAGCLQTANLAVLPRVDALYSARPYAEFLRNDARADRIFVYQLPRAWTYGLAFYFRRELPEWQSGDLDPALVLTTRQGLAAIQALGRTSRAIDTAENEQPLIYVPVNAAPRAAHQ